jgi:hypothetical protein
MGPTLNAWEFSFLRNRAGGDTSQFRFIVSACWSPVVEGVALGLIGN